MVVARCVVFCALVATFSSLSVFAAQAEQPVAPAGFTALFNGQDLSGWRGLGHTDPAELAAMSADARSAKQTADNEDLKKHWRVENGELVNDGHGVYGTTDKDYADFELLLEYKTVAQADSGIYLRGNPQVQIWDTTKAGGKWNLGANLGSGGLWNNRHHSRFPVVHADKAFGEWNGLRIILVGHKTTVYLNGHLIVDRETMENFWQRGTPLPASGPIQLQTHGGEIRFRNVFLREITNAEQELANQAAWHTALLTRDKEGFVPLFAGKATQGWTDHVNFEDETFSGRGWYTARKFGDFALRFEFKVSQHANSGIGIRSKVNHDAAYYGMEIQILDDTGEKYQNLKPWQYHGSIYGIAAVRRGYQKPLGEWNVQEIRAEGDRIRVTLNGTVIVDANIREATQGGTKTLSGAGHPGLFYKDGYLAILGHSEPGDGDATFRRMRIKEL